MYNFCIQLKTRHPNTLSNKLVDIADRKKKQDNTKYVKPGLNISLKI